MLHIVVASSAYSKFETRPAHMIAIIGAVIMKSMYVFIFKREVMLFAVIYSEAFLKFTADSHMSQENERCVFTLKSL